MWYCESIAQHVFVSANFFSQNKEISMGITPQTLALASTRGTPILDNKSGEMIHVEYLFPGEIHPVYVLVYSDGIVRGVDWRSGQAEPGGIVWTRKTLYEES